MSLLVGTHYYPATGESASRQADACRALAGLRSVQTVNLQWAGGAYDVPEIPTLPVLVQDSRKVSRSEGPRKPIISEMLNALASEAGARGCRHFLFANGDIVITTGLLDLIDRDPRQGFAVARTDIDPADGAAIGVMRFGTDVFVFATDWWVRNARRFRPYIAGEPVWDNVFTAILLAHSNAEYLDEPGLVLHPRHETAWHGSPYQAYTRYLAALDRPYFSMWAGFHAALAASPPPVTADAVRALRGRLFDTRTLRRGQALQWARAAKAHTIYALGMLRP